MDYEQFQTLLFWLAAGTFIFAICLGMSGRIVVYYDRRDFLESNAPIFIVVIGAIVAASLSSKSAPDAQTPIQWIVRILSWLIAAYFAVKGFLNAIHYNRSLPLGIFVGVLKLSMMIVAALWVLCSFIMTASEHRRHTMFDWLMLVFVGWILIALINGEKVEERRAALS